MRATNSYDAAFNVHTHSVRTANEAAARLYPDLKGLTAFAEVQAKGFDNKTIRLLDLSDTFWASTLSMSGSKEAPVVYCPDEDQFRRYNPATGIYEPVRDSVVVTELANQLDRCAADFPAHVDVASFVALKTRKRLISVVERAKEVLAVGGEFFKLKENLLPVSNGVVNMKDGKLHQSNPAIPVTDKLPVCFNPDAQPDMFLDKFLRHVVAPEDIELLQQYLGQLLDGHNHSQSILILNGQSSWGKSTLMHVIGSIIGWDRVGIIREQIFKDGPELSYYRGKHLLYHPDMAPDFLNRPEACLFKQVVGGDPIWTESADSNGMVTIHGNFPVVLSCNGNPTFHIQQDEQAWLRRVVAVPFRQPQHDRHVGRLAEVIVRNEAAGVLNWLLAGRTKLLRESHQLKLTSAQRERAATILLGSESPKAFVRCCIGKQKDGVILMATIYEAYQNWCRDAGVKAFSLREFMETAKAEIETAFGMTPRHDLRGADGKAKRGWSGLSLQMRKG